ncbi:MAG: VCBS repeat-containing protein [marine benthic group bacterium]|nr:VCBS repeat-containing protein [Candidatus Carthagonibacter metallireducens]
MIFSGLACVALLALAACDQPRLDEQVGSADTLRLLAGPIATGPAPSKVAVGDLTGDGHADLLVSVTDADGLLLLGGDGTGRFNSFEQFPGGEKPVDLALGDLDGDGDLDVAVANHETDYVTLLANDGRGDFEPYPGSPLSVDLGPHPHAVLLSDLDRDGSLDLLVDDRQGEAILVYSGDGRGRFGTPPERVDVGGDPYRGMVLGDLDGDGGMDLVTPNAGEVAVMLGAESGRFDPPRGIAADRPFEVGLGDMNGDGALDLLIAEEPGRIRVLEGLGDGKFEVEPLFETRWAAGAKAVAVGDTDGDGLADAAVTNWNSNHALVLFGGQDEFRSELVTAGENPWGVSVADLTGDGRDEILVLDNEGDALRLYSSGSRD